MNLLVIDTLTTINLPGSLKIAGKYILIKKHNETITTPSLSKGSEMVSNRWPGTWFVQLYH